MLEQTVRHSFIASTLGISHIVVCVNKMDLVGFSQQAFDDICTAYRNMAEKLRIGGITFIPISAKLGDNVVTESEHMPWYDGGTLLHLKDTAPTEI